MAREMQKDQADKRLGDMDGTTLLQHVLETMGGGLFTVDVNGKITSWNRGMEEITGYAPEAVVGQPCALLDGNECFAGPAGEHRERCPLFSNEFIRSKSCRIRSRDGESVKVVKNARDKTRALARIPTERFAVTAFPSKWAASAASTVLTSDLFGQTPRLDFSHYMPPRRKKKKEEPRNPGRGQKLRLVQPGLISRVGLARSALRGFLGSSSPNISSPEILAQSQLVT